MWWAFPDPLDICLRQDGATAAGGGGVLATVQCPPTLPLPQVLDRLREAAPDLFHRAVLHVRLAPAACKVLSLEAPEAIAGWKTAEAAALQQAARMLDSPAEDLVVALDPSRPGEFAAMPLPVRAGIVGWAARHGLQLASLRPDGAAGRIDFVRPRVALLWACALTGLLVLASLCAFFAVTNELRARALRADARAVASQRDQLSRERAPAPPPSSGALQAAHLLQADPNELFAVLENMAEPAATLQSASVGAGGREFRLEYRLQSPQVAARVTERLNAGEPAQRWRLVSLSAPRTSSPAGDARYLASWARR